MYSSAHVVADPTVKYQTNEFAWVIPVALLIVLGGVTAATVAVCGWGHVKGFSFNVLTMSATITCK